MPDNRRITYLFNLYTQNKASEAEISELFEALKYFSAEDQLNKPLSDLWEKFPVEETAYEPDWDQLYSKVTGKKVLPDNPTVIRSSKNVWYYAAAAVFIGVFLTLLLNYGNRETNYITYKVPYKTTKTIIFEDGSKAILNAGTTIKYPKSFGGKTREVNLDGEGYFQVTHLKNKPFIVHSGKLQTQVLGTSFNVNAYAKSARMSVTVVTGKVSVKEASSGKQYMLTPNQEAVFNAKKSSFQKVLVADALNNIVWQDGRLSFENASLDEVAEELSLKFGVQTTLSNPQLKNYRISAVFHNKQLSQILTVITKLTNSNYSLHDNKAVIFCTTAINNQD